MITFEDLKTAQAKGEREVAAFCAATIAAATAGAAYREMLDAQEYYNGRNPFLQRMINRVTFENGTAINLDAQIKITCDFFRIIADHIVCRLWDFPVRLDCDENKQALGLNFDAVAMECATYAAIHGVCYGFYNLDRVQTFRATEYIPLLDEYTGEHMAGIRFWQLAASKPMFVQLYEIDGVTVWRSEAASDAAHGGTQSHGASPGKLILHTPKGPYRTQSTTYGERTLTHTAPGAPYARLPIVPMYINPAHTSELTEPIKTKINAYDAKETGFMDEALREKLIYWTISGFGGNADELARMLKTIRELGIIATRSVHDEARVDSKIVHLPFEAHLATLAHLEAAIWRDARILDPGEITGGSLTNVAIKAALMRENKKMAGVEHEARLFVQGLLDVAGIRNESITFKHSMLTNDEEITRRLNYYANEVPLRFRLDIDPLFGADIAADIAAAIEHDDLVMDAKVLAAQARLNALDVPGSIDGQRSQ